MILRREIPVKGNSRAFINDIPITITTLAEIGDLLVDIHSQNEHQSLLKKETHRYFIDALGELDALLKSTAESYARVMAEFDRVIGLDRICAFHLNDSLKPAGSKVDRHAHIGRGTIGRTGFACLMRDPRFFAIPMILETPKGDDGSMDRANLALLRQLAGEAPE